MNPQLTGNGIRMLKALVRAFDRPTDVSAYLGLTPIDLAVRAGFDASKVSFVDAETTLSELRRRGYVENVGVEKNVGPTPAGLDYARWLLRPRWQKLLTYFQGDLRAVVVALITALLTTLVLRFLGWT